MSVTIAPRHRLFDGVVEIEVKNGDSLVFRGLGDARGLDCDWC